jgi:TATA-box binding protein (TBP) (component of TFIID and TFIIIB)
MSIKSRWDTFEFTDYLNVDEIEIKNLPAGISVSTMCASCKLNTRLIIPNIEKYLQLNSDDILTVKTNKEKLRTLISIKNKPKRIKKTENKTKQKDTSKNHFYNQITVVVRVGQGQCKDLNEAPKINMKLFRNGSVQMSGCKSIKNINIALNKLITKLKEVKAKIEDGKICEKEFIEEPDKITVKDFKIDMINSNYQVNMQIDRDKLYNLLLKKKIKSSYEPCIRACVIIKYAPLKDNIEQKEVSVFVFQKGNIIITGARSKSHIMSAYNYMNEILLTHTDEIIKKDENEEEELILDIYNDIMKDVNMGIIKV